MPFLSPGKTSNAIDRNAVSSDRTRRNWQRITQGAITRTLAVGSGLANGPGGIVVKVDPNGAIVSGPNGIAVQVDGTTVNIVGDQLVASSGLTHQQVMARVSMGV